MREYLCAPGCNQAFELAAASQLAIKCGASLLSVLCLRLAEWVQPFNSRSFRSILSPFVFDYELIYEYLIHITAIKLIASIRQSLATNYFMAVMFTHKLKMTCAFDIRTRKWPPTN